MYSVTLVTQISELEQIAVLSKENLRNDLSAEEKQSQGFITWEYTLPLLQKLQAIAPAVIVKYGDAVVGYALTAFKETAAVLPVLNDMIHHLEPLSFNGKQLKNYRYYVMGQVCIAKAHRGKGVFDQLYQHHKKIYSNQYDLLVTEISTSNHRSLKAHQNIGFQTIHTYQDTLDEWDVVVWNWIK
jgi:GNAT superfamily N-acetyltransferase